MKELIGRVLLNMEFQQAESSAEGLGVYYREEMSRIIVVNVIDKKKMGIWEDEHYSLLKQQVMQVFKIRGHQDIHMMSILISDSKNEDHHVGLNDSFCWMVCPNSRKLIIYERQVADFYGIRKPMEQVLEAGYVEGEWETGGKSVLSSMLEGSYITIILVALNIIIFLICTFTGNLLYNIGAISVLNILEDGEYYRILSSMFLHAGAAHLINNMLLLYVLGEIVEKEIGHGKFLCLYLLAGIGGNVLSMWYEYTTSSFGSSVGASGAIFGVIGALLYLVIIDRGRLQNFTLGRILFFIVLTLYSGFTSTNVDNAAHVGGLISGLILIQFLYHKRRKEKKTGAAHEN